MTIRSIVVCLCMATITAQAQQKGKQCIPGGKLLAHSSRCSHAYARKSVNTPGKSHVIAVPVPPDNIAKKKPVQSMKERAMLLKAYASQNGFDISFCYIINMNPASGAFRFFIFDFGADQFVDSGLVAHGRCNEDFLKGRRYGNDIGCGCTSLGRYKIGEKYTGKWGSSYRLHGLDSSNSNVYARNVVLHAHQSIPNREIMYPLFQSDGCVTVSPAYLAKMSKGIDIPHSPVLLEIYDSYELK